VAVATAAAGAAMGAGAATEAGASTEAGAVTGARAAMGASVRLVLRAGSRRESAAKGTDGAGLFVLSFIFVLCAACTESVLLM